MISEFGKVIIFIAGALLFLMITLAVSFLIRPQKPNSEKLSTYECGEETIGSAWKNFPIRYYTIALIFLIFDVEVIFLFPWAVVFGKKEYLSVTQGEWTKILLIELIFFVAILVVGLVYIWAKGYLTWKKPAPLQPQILHPLPETIYKKYNQKQSEGL